MIPDPGCVYASYTLSGGTDVFCFVLSVYSTRHGTFVQIKPLINQALQKNLIHSNHSASAGTFKLHFLRFRGEVFGPPPISFPRRCCWIGRQIQFRSRRSLGTQEEGHCRQDTGPSPPRACTCAQRWDSFCFLRFPSPSYHISSVPVCLSLWPQTYRRQVLAAGETFGDFFGHTTNMKFNYFSWQCFCV